MSDIDITREQVQEAAKMPAVASLVELSELYASCAARGVYRLETPGTLAAWIEEKKGYRRPGFRVETRFHCKDISIGKRDGMIFSFEPETTLFLGEHDGHVKWVEMSLDDLEGHMPELAEQLDKLTGTTLKALNRAIKEKIASNKSMYKILSAGFAAAVREKLELARADSLSNIPGFGEFG